MKEFYQNVTANVVLINPDGLVLGVSRKDNHQDFGLIGGKMDLEDNMDPMRTAIRECKEETGLDISNLRLIFAIHKSGNMGYTYLADYSGEIEHDEPHVVKWVPFEVLINGPFGRYNQMVSESLNSMGIKYIKEIDEDKILKELSEFISKTVRKGYTKPFIFDSIRKNNSNSYMWYVNVLTYGGFPIDEEWCDHDKEYEKAISDIGEKYNIILKFPYYYYCK